MREINGNESIEEFVCNNIVCVDYCLFYNIKYQEKVLDWLLKYHVNVESEYLVPHKLYDCVRRFMIYIPENIAELEDIVVIKSENSALPNCLREFKCKSVNLDDYI